MPRIMRVCVCWSVWPGLEPSGQIETLIKTLSHRSFGGCYMNDTHTHTHTDALTKTDLCQDRVNSQKSPFCFSKGGSTRILSLFCFIQVKKKKGLYSHEKSKKKKRLTSGAHIAKRRM